MRPFHIASESQRVKVPESFLFLVPNDMGVRFVIASPLRSGIATPWFVNGRDKKSRVSEAFQFVTIQSKCYRPVNQVDGYDQAVVSRDANKNAFQALERAVFDSHTLSHCQVRMWAAFSLRAYQRTYSLNLFVGNWRRLFAGPDKSDHTISLKYAHSRVH